jgi:hypothetical protein
VTLCGGQSQAYLSVCFAHKKLPIQKSSLVHPCAPPDDAMTPMAFLSHPLVASEFRSASWWRDGRAGVMAAVPQTSSGER